MTFLSFLFHSFFCLLYLLLLISFLLTACMCTISTFAPVAEEHAPELLGNQSTLLLGYFLFPSIIFCCWTFQTCLYIPHVRKDLWGLEMQFCGSQKRRQDTSESFTAPSGGFTSLGGPVLAALGVGEDHVPHSWDTAQVSLLPGRPWSPWRCSEATPPPTVNFDFLFDLYMGYLEVYCLISKNLEIF